MTFIMVTLNRYYLEFLRHVLRQLVLFMRFKSRANICSCKKKKLHNLGCYSETKSCLELVSQPETFEHILSYLHSTTATAEKPQSPPKMNRKRFYQNRSELSTFRCLLFDNINFYNFNSSSSLVIW